MNLLLPGMQKLPKGVAEAYDAISPCTKYRYDLRYKLADVAGDRRVLFCMLNPSTATKEESDPTLCACMDFARAWKCAWLQIVNAYAFRATDPDELRTAHDPIGPDNDAFIAAATTQADLRVCAWGRHVGHERAVDVTRLLRGIHSRPVERIVPAGELRHDGHRLFALVINKDGTPKHPLYIKRTTPLIPFEEAL